MEEALDLSFDRLLMMMMMTQVSNVKKMRLVGAELFHADRRTDQVADVTKLIVAFRNFANPPAPTVGSSIFRFIVSLLMHSVSTCQRNM